VPSNYAPDLRIGGVMRRASRQPIGGVALAEDADGTGKAVLSGHAITKTWHALLLNERVTHPYAQGEGAALEMDPEIPGGSKRVTPAADLGYDTREFVDRLRELDVTPHGAQKTTGRRSAVDGRTVRHEGY
jgi:hypothetical protein